MENDLLRVWVCVDPLVWFDPPPWVQVANCDCVDESVNQRWGGSSVSDEKPSNSATRCGSSQG